MVPIELIAPSLDAYKKVESQLDKLLPITLEKASSKENK